ncbi:hypothetical protein RvY_18078-2 [Ramazzottius varieornatus]|uniref:Uncharacterized protein n=1 Tax=Ramazzottius varieornatus TaxID=947166 RepID=A0A1D1W6A2_RAMVA|nr:hypothetical protein RvY_18078-2 [Ramazzottius varieornatus]
MGRTNPFKLTSGTWSVSVADASKNSFEDRWRVCHVCSASRRTSSSAPYCFSARSLSLSTQQSCMELSHITGIVMNLPAEAYFIHCFTKFQQNGSTQSMERGCQVRLAPVQDRCDSKGYYCSCNFNGCNSQEWNGGGWQAAGQSSQMPVGAAASPIPPVAPRNNVSNAPPVPAGHTGGWNVSGLVRHCYWCKGTVERRSGVLTGCFGEGTALREGIVECSEKDPNMRTDLFLNRDHELECLTVFRYSTNPHSTHEAIMERKCALRRSMASPVQRCSQAESKDDATGGYAEVVCRCSNDNYCNDDTWPTTQMGHPPFTVAAAVIPPLGSDLWGRGRSCHQCEGTVNVKTGKVHGCFFQDGLSNATAVRCAHAAEYVQAILRNLPAQQHFIHCVAQFDEGNSTDRLVVRRYCDVRLSPVPDGCTAEGKVRTCRCNSQHCNNDLWSNQTGLMASPASTVVQTVGPLDVMQPVKPTDISRPTPLKPEKLASYQCVSPPHEKDIINGHCFKPQHSPLVNCSDDPRFLSLFKDFPSFVPMCETEMKTTAKKPCK